MFQKITNMLGNMNIYIYKASHRYVNNDLKFFFVQIVKNSFFDQSLES